MVEPCPDSRLHHARTFNPARLASVFWSRFRDIAIIYSRASPATGNQEGVLPDRSDLENELRLGGTHMVTGAKNLAGMPLKFHRWR